MLRSAFRAIDPAGFRKWDVPQRMQSVLITVPVVECTIVFNNDRIVASPGTGRLVRPLATSSRCQLEAVA